MIGGVEIEPPALAENQVKHIQKQFSRKATSKP